MHACFQVAVPFADMLHRFGQYRSQSVLRDPDLFAGDAFGQLHGQGHHLVGQPFLQRIQSGRKVGQQRTGTGANRHAVLRLFLALPLGGFGQTGLMAALPRGLQLARQFLFGLACGFLGPLRRALVRGGVVEGHDRHRLPGILPADAGRAGRSRGQGIRPAHRRLRCSPRWCLRRPGASRFSGSPSVGPPPRTVAPDRATPGLPSATRPRASSCS